jgi:hypothetical protein
MPLKHICKCDRSQRKHMTLDKDGSIETKPFVIKKKWFEKLKDGASNILERGGNLAKIAGNIGLKVGEFTGNPELMAISEGLVLGGGAANYVGRRLENGTDGMEIEEINQNNEYLKQLGKRVYDSGSSFIRSKQRNNYEL